MAMSPNKPRVRKSVNRFRNTSPYISKSFASIIGPKTMKANFETKGNVMKFAAINASLVLQRDSRKARPIIAVVANTA